MKQVASSSSRAGGRLAGEGLASRWQSWPHARRTSFWMLTLPVAHVHTVSWRKSDSLSHCKICFYETSKKKKKKTTTTTSRKATPNSTTQSDFAVGISIDLTPGPGASHTFLPIQMFPFVYCRYIHSYAGAQKQLEAGHP